VALLSGRSAKRQSTVRTVVQLRVVNAYEQSVNRRARRARDVGLQTLFAIPHRSLTLDFEEFRVGSVALITLL